MKLTAVVTGLELLTSNISLPTGSLSNYFPISY